MPFCVLFSHDLKGFLFYQNFDTTDLFTFHEKATPPYKDLCRLPKTICLAKKMGEKLGRSKVLFQKMFGAKESKLGIYGGMLIFGNISSNPLGVSQTQYGRKRPPQKQLVFGEVF